MVDQILEPVEVICPQYRRTEIVYLDKEKMPECPKYGVKMVLHDILKNGKMH
jgi:hypothetical protein